MDARARRFVGLAVVAVLLVSSLLVLHGGVETGRAAAADRGEPVDIAGVVVLRVRVPVDGREPLEQVSHIYQQWVNVLEEAKENLSPDAVRVEDVDGVPTIYIGSIPVISVDEGHARLNGTTPNGLAEVWAVNWKRAIERYMEIHGY